MEFTTETESAARALKSDYKKYLIRIPILIVINTIMFGVLPFDGRPLNERLLWALEAFAFSCTVCGFVLGLVVALFPYRQLGYGRKYWRGSLLSIYVLHIVMLVLELVCLVLFVINGSL